MKLEPALQKDMERAKEDLFRKHCSDPNFTGCGIGLRRRGGKVTDEVVIIAMVQDKLPAGAVSRRWLLPKTVSAGGAAHPVDVVEVGPVFAASGAGRAVPAGVTGGVGGPYTGRFDPPIQGSSISVADPTDYPSNTDHGTFGCLVRDRTDNTICMLSANHVIAEIDDVSKGTKIVQPATIDGGTDADAFATFKRYVELVPETGTASVDAAIAQLTDQSSYSQATVNDRMAPISAGHPAVGMAVAYDTSGNSFLTRMDATLDQLNCELLPATAGSPCVVAPEIGVNIEKVGRTSGYTSSTIDAISVQVSIRFPGEDTTDFTGVSENATLSDLIWSQYFLVGGDSGAVACVGGDGATYIYWDQAAATCPLISSSQTYYGLPSATSDNDLTNAVQDQFLSQSQAGTLLIGAVYLNKDMVIARLQQDTGSLYGQPTAQAAVQSFYSSYRDLLADEMADPHSATTVTPANAEDAVNLVLDTTGYVYDSATGAYTVTGPYTLEEAQAAYILTYLMGHAMSGNGTDPGMTRAQATAYFDQGDVYNVVYNTLRRVPTYVLP